MLALTPTKYFPLQGARPRCSVSVPSPVLFSELQAPSECKQSNYPLPLGGGGTESLLPCYPILPAPGRTALNGCGLVIWGLICKANANYLKLGLSGVEHSLKAAFVLFENHSLA